jgi:hypothetical protein
MADFTTVFLSSTARDLQPYRDAVAEAIAKLAGFHCVRMENFGAVDADPLEVCRRKVAESEVFVGLVGHLNGSSPEGSPLSFTQVEYEVAKKAGKPRLLFVADEDFAVPARLDREPEEAYQRQLQFREQVKRERTVVSFHDPQSLATLVVAALQNHQKQEKAVEPESREGLLSTDPSGTKVRTRSEPPQPEVVMTPLRHSRLDLLHHTVFAGFGLARAWHS